LDGSGLGEKPQPKEDPPLQLQNSLLPAACRPWSQRVGSRQPAGTRCDSGFPGITKTNASRTPFGCR